MRAILVINKISQASSAPLVMNKNRLCMVKLSLQSRFLFTKKYRNRIIEKEMLKNESDKNRNAKKL